MQPAADRPPWAAYIWYDAYNIYVQLPTGVEYPMAFPLTEGGLAKALKVITWGADKSKAKARGLNGHHPKNPPIIQRPTKREEFSDDLHEAARRALSKLGIT